MNGELVVTAPMDITQRLQLGPHYSEKTVHIWLLNDVSEQAVSLLRDRLTQYGSRGRVGSFEFEPEDTRGFRIDMKMNYPAWQTNLVHINGMVAAALSTNG